MQPSISYEQEVASQAIVRLQFGQQVVPISTDRKGNDRRSPIKPVLTDEPLQTRLIAILPAMLLMLLSVHASTSLPMIPYLLLQAMCDDKKMLFRECLV